MNRIEALQKDQISAEQLIEAMPKLASGEIAITYDEFGNAQIPVVIADLAAKQFLPKMKKFSGDLIYNTALQAQQNLETAQKEAALQAALKESCSLVLQKMAEAKLK